MAYVFLFILIVMAGICAMLAVAMLVLLVTTIINDAFLDYKHADELRRAVEYCRRLKTDMAIEESIINTARELKAWRQYGLLTADECAEVLKNIGWSEE